LPFTDYSDLIIHVAICKYFTCLDKIFVAFVLIELAGGYDCRWLRQGYLMIRDGDSWMDCSNIKLGDVGKIPGEVSTGKFAAAHKGGPYKGMQQPVFDFVFDVTRTAHMDNDRKA
jgi:hypothetical protein